MANILSISSAVVYGHVGNSAAAFAMQALGHEVWQIPTVLLSHHPGHGRPFGRRTPGDEILGYVKALEARGWLGRCDAIMSGYLAETDQGAAIAEAAGRVKQANPSALYLCDPILGDEDTGAYTSPEIADVVKELAGLADIVTPNLFELAVLAGEKPATTGDAIGLARTLKPGIVVLTSSFAAGGRIASLAVMRDQALRVETRRHAKAQRGAGDLFAGLFLGALLLNTQSGAAQAGRGSPGEALALAAGVTADIVGASLAAGRDELALAEFQGLMRLPDTHPVVEIVG
ncbi:MAG: pyridoxal kinase [Parvibaculaceae bacterium]|nr:pyridoxal kinase [Parvibaculaceae bacterium]